MLKQTFRMSNKVATETADFKQQVCKFFSIKDYREYSLFDQNGEEIDQSLDKIHKIVEYCYMKEFKPDILKHMSPENKSGKACILFLGKKTPNDKFFEYFFQHDLKTKVNKERERILKEEQEQQNQMLGGEEATGKMDRD